MQIIFLNNQLLWCEFNPCIFLTTFATMTILGHQCHKNLQAISKIYWMKETATFFFFPLLQYYLWTIEKVIYIYIYIYVPIAVIICERWMQKTYRSHWNKFQVILVEEQRPEKIQRRSTPTTQKVWQQIQIAKYPQITYSTFGSTNCGVSDLVRCDFWRG